MARSEQEKAMPRIGGSPREVMQVKTMKVVTVAASKGGCGKSTLTALLAVRAAQDGERVALLDLNYDQGSLSAWWMQRIGIDEGGDPDDPEHNPVLFRTGDNLSQTIRGIADEGFDLLIVDTAPLDLDLIELAVKLSNAVLVPVRPSPLDLMAISPVIEVCEKHRKPFGFVLSVVDNRKHTATLNATTAKALATAGPVLATQLFYDPSHITSMATGNVGFESSPKLLAEATGLWTEVKKLVATKVPILARRVGTNG
jgi:chromosome partitioning protein